MAPAPALTKGPRAGLRIVPREDTPKSVSPAGLKRAIRRAALAPVCLLLAALQPAHTLADDRPSPSSTLAIVAPLTGPFSETGSAIRDAATAALADRSTASATTPRLVFVDDACRAQEAEAAARKLVADGVAAIIGHPCGSASAAAAKVYGPAGILFLSLSRHPAALPKTAGLAPLRLAGRDDRQAATIASAILADSAAATGFVAIVHDRTSYALAIARDLDARLTAKGRAAALNEGIVAGEKDYGATAARLVNAGIGTLVFAGFPAEAAVLLRDLGERRAAVTIYVTDAVGADEFPRLAGRHADGVRVVLPDLPEIAPATATPTSTPTLAPDHRSPSTAVDLAARAARQAVRTWLDAATATAGTDPGRIAAHLRSRTLGNDADTALFDADGSLALPAFAVFAWRNGHLTRLTP